MKQIRRLGSAAALVGAAFLLASCSDSPQAPTSPAATELAGASQAGSMPAPRQPQANFEIDFMTDMIDHHAMAIEMSEICLEKAVHQELRERCQMIIETQSAEIERMQSWLSNWYGVSHEPEMKPGDMKMMERLASLTGADFEITFMEMMIKHHEKAIKESRHCLDKAWHEELLQLCHDIIAAQSAEIALFESWLCQWYGRC